MSEEKATDVGPSGIEVAYERIGDPQAPPVLLIMGAGAQLVAWPDGFCAALTDRGFQVIRFDNRDSGRSSHFPDSPVPDLQAALAGDLSSASYTLSDMAADAVGLLDALGIVSAHVVGASMGAMIGQTMAIEYPDRVRSLTSVMSTTGDLAVGQPDLKALASLAGLAYDRCHDPAGTMRQFVMIASRPGPRPAATLPGMAADLLPPFPDDAFRRVLCVVAHPDDVEYGTSSAVAAWTANGTEVAYLLLTRGEAGMDASPPERTAALRTEEQIASSHAVGVTEVDFLGYTDGVLEYSLDMRRDIARVIRRRRPDAVLVTTWEVEFAAGLNQADHRVAGMATLDAVRDAGNRWVFPELLEEGLEPHAVRWLLIAGDPRPTHGVDVTGEPLERGIAALEAHAQYLAGLPGHPPVRPMISGITAYLGRSMGVPHGVLFRAWDFQAPPPIAAEIAAMMAAGQDG